MRIDLPPPPTEAAPTLAMTVECRSDRNEVVATIHEATDAHRLYAELHMALLPGGLAIWEVEHAGDRESFLRPPDPDGLRRLLIARLRKLATRYAVSPEHWRFIESQGRKTHPLDALAFPPSWRSARTLLACQRMYDTGTRIDQWHEALKHADQATDMLAQGHFRKAVRLFRQARQEAPEYYLPALALAELALRESHWEEAADLLKEAHELFERRDRFPKKQQARDEERLKIAAERLRLSRRGSSSSSHGLSPTPAAMEPKEPSLPAAPPVPIEWRPLRWSGWLGERLERGPFEALEAYRLRLTAEEVLTFGGFNELLAPTRSRIRLFEHQIRAARIALRRMRGRALLADEVGLGKTIEAGLVLKEYLLRRMVSRALIVAPPVLVDQWRQELAEKFDIEAELPPAQDPPGLDGSFWRASRIAVASLALARREPHRTAILSQTYDLVIVDEAHHLRRRDTLAWRMINQINTKYLLLLTATPIQNDLDELYSLATLLRPGQLGTPAQFSAQFKERGDARKPRNPEALRSLLRDIMIRHTRASAAVPLPRRVARTVSVPMAEPERDVYERLSAFVRRLGHSAGENPLFLLTLLQREAGSDLRAALPTLEKIGSRLSSQARSELQALSADIAALPEPAKLNTLRKVLSRVSGKCLIFTEFRQTQALLAQALKADGESVEVFHGGLSSAQKGETLKRFESSSRIMVATPAGGEGANLQFCRVLINYDLPWNPMRIEQRIGRLHRIGQTGEVTIYNLASPGTVEDHLLRILDEKLNLFELVVGEAETILGDLTEEKDFEQLLMETWLEAADPREAAERMERLGERILEEKEKYLETKRLDEHLFGEDYEAG